MALLRKIRELKSEINTGFGTNSNNTGGRFIDKDGRPNVIKRGTGILERFSWYHTLLGMKLWKFGLLLFSIYIGINLVFAGIYYIIGIDHLAGIKGNSLLTDFWEVFFFSAQTFTTVGYGRVSPVGFPANAVSTLEAFVGLLSFALATGLFYGRFSQPKAFLKFSHNALVAPYRNITALMLRLVPYKNNNLSDVEVKVTLGISTEENGRLANKFFDLELEYSRINALSLSWTIVHPIDDKSPFYGLSREDIANTKMEVMVYLKAFDSVYSNNVTARTSYISSEIIWGAKFRMMFHPSDDKSKTILSLEKLNEFDRVPLPETQTINAG